jgi:hypothetical protein
MVQDRVEPYLINRLWDSSFEISRDELEKEQLTRKEENHNPSNYNVE